MTSPADLQEGDTIMVTLPVVVVSTTRVDNGTHDIYIEGPFSITVSDDADITVVG